MYIGDVLERARTYFPSEYTDDEMYDWCDEVSAMLMTEDRNIYAQMSVCPDSDGNILLPDGVGFENVVSVSADGKMFDKSYIGNGKAFSGDVKVVYLKPYEPIRHDIYEGFCEVQKNNLYLFGNPFEKADILKVQTNGKEFTVTVLDVGFDGKSDFIVTGDGELDGVTNGEMTIERVVTDWTVCEAPYDSMYIDYILAKIGLYQQNFDMYNTFMAAFNSRLLAYKKWLVNYMPQRKLKFSNWW